MKTILKRDLVNDNVEISVKEFKQYSKVELGDFSGDPYHQYIPIYFMSNSKLLKRKYRVAKEVMRRFEERIVNNSDSAIPAGHAVGTRINGVYSHFILVHDYIDPADFLSIFVHECIHITQYVAENSGDHKSLEYPAYLAQRLVRNLLCLCKTKYRFTKR